MRFRWQRFRSFRDTRWVELRPLTVVIGANNTGKTTLYEPLLLLRQSQLSPRSYPALVTKGDLINSGAFADLVYDHDDDSAIAFNFDGLTRPPAMPRSLDPRIQGSTPREVRLSFRPGREHGIELHRFVIGGPDGKPILERVARDDGRYALRRFPPAPTIDRRTRRQTQAVAREWIRLVREETPENFTFPGTTALNSLNLEALDALPKLEKVFDWITRYAILNMYIRDSLGTFIDGVSYLGPLRALPQRTYELSGEMPRSVGRGGALAPEILFRHRNAPLFDDVRESLARFELPAHIEFKSSDPNTFSMFLRRTTKSPWINYADCGIGLSQLLPLIVQGFHAATGALVIAEQPEIHLNPRLQAELADLFVGLIKRGVHVIVETHSEHLLLRLRKLAADKELNVSDFALLFTEKRGDESSVRRIDVKTNGGIARSEWPQGFFEESLVESLALAAAQDRHHAS